MPSDGPVPDFERYLRRPNAARIYDYLLGGCESFEPDRQEAEALLTICPGLRDVARENRMFLARAIAWAAGQGVTQFADLGAGAPMPRRAGAGEPLPEIHETARTVNPAARCAYVDSDPVVVMHSGVFRAQAGHGAPAEGIAVAGADLREPGKVLANPEVLAVINPAEPVCLVLGLVLDLLPARQAREVVAGYAHLIGPGSLMVVSCARFDDDAVWEKVRAACTAAVPHNHARSQLASFLAGLELVPPGLAAAQGWRGGWRDVRVTPPGPAYVLAGVARKR